LINEGILFLLGGRDVVPQNRRKTSLITLIVILVVAALLTALILAERYVTARKGQEVGPLVMENVPAWVTEALLNDIWAAAGARTFALDRDTTQRVAQTLDTVAWLDDVEVWMTDKEVRARARWRKPLARVDLKTSRFYVSADGTVLEPVSLSDLPIVTITGAPLVATPTPGQTLTVAELKAALALLALMEEMDLRAVPDRPLLTQIDHIDMTNYQGRRDSNKPHICLYAKDDTQIIWGAELGAWDKHMEARDEEKLAKLYAYYAEVGSLMGKARYIDLREPQGELPLPMDKYGL
jgi:hypothetical protein